MISTAQRDTIFALLLRSLAMCSAGIICLIFIFVGRESWMAFDSAVQPSERAFELSHLVTDDAWNPSASDPNDREFNLRPMIFGSLLATFGSALLAAPVSYTHLTLPTKA